MIALRRFFVYAAVCVLTVGPIKLAWGASDLEMGRALIFRAMKIEGTAILRKDPDGISQASVLWKRGIPYLERALVENRRDPSVVLNLSLAYGKTDRYQEQFELLAGAVRQFPFNTDILFEAGRACVMVGNFATAEQAVQQLRTLGDRDRALVLRNLIDHYQH